MKMTTIRTRIAAVAAFAIMTGGLPGLNATEKQIAGLEEDIAELKAQLEEVGGTGNAATQLLSNIETAKEEIEETKAALPGKEKDLAAKFYLLGIYPSAFRVVTSMVAGDDLGTIQLNNGDVVEGASFLKTEKGGILVQTGTGTRSIPISQLPPTLSGKMQLPPNIASPGITLDAVKTTKPALLQSKEDIAAASTPATANGTGDTPSATTTVATPAPQVSQADAYTQIQKRNAARQKQILQIKDQYSQLFAQKKKARSEKATADAGFRSAKIKKSRTEVDSTMNMHNSKIAAIEEEEARLRNEMARIQSEFE